MDPVKYLVNGSNQAQTIFNHTHQGTACTEHTACPRSSDPFYIVSYYMEWVTTSWTHSSLHTARTSDSRVIRFM